MGKRFDAKAVMGYCDTMSDAYTTYGQAADHVQYACTAFADNNTFTGHQAEVTKELVGTVEVGLMDEILAVNERIRGAQNNIMEMFASDVDAAPNARIDEDVLTGINENLKGYADAFDAIGKQVESIYSRLLMFSKYGSFTKPDFSCGRAAASAFITKASGTKAEKDATNNILISLGYWYNTGTGELGLLSYQTLYEMQRWSEHGIAILYNDAGSIFTGPSEQVTREIWDDLIIKTIDDEGNAFYRVNVENKIVKEQILCKIDDVGQHDNYNLVGSNYTSEEIADALCLMLYGNEGIRNNNLGTNGNYQTILEIPTDLYVACIQIIDKKLAVSEEVNYDGSDVDSIDGLTDVFIPASKNAGK